MLHGFEFWDMKGDLNVAPYEGAALIERCDANGWRIAGIDLRGWKTGVSDATINLAQDDPLYTRIATHLLQTQRIEIEAAWAEHVRERRAEKEAVS